MRDGVCYSWHNAQQTWATADQACAAIGRHLVVYNSKEESEEVADALAIEGTAWIGLFYDDFGDEWIWVTKEPVLDTQWADGDGEPSVETEPQGVAQREGDWQWLTPETATGYICESRLPTVWEGNKHLYWKTETQQTWPLAQANCQERKGHLVTFESGAEQNYAVSLVSGCGTSGDPCWIGASDLEEEGVFRWVTGEPLEGGFDNWKDGAPTAVDEQSDCVKVDPRFGLWTDVHCDAITHGICELE